MSTLEDKFILDTYQGVIHSNGEIPAGSQSKLYDGLGNETALSIGRVGEGIKIENVEYPTTDCKSNDIIVGEVDNKLKYSSFTELLSSIGGYGGSGIFELPTLTFVNGIITNVANTPAGGGLKAFNYTGIPQVFTVPSGTNKVKFHITGGGGGASQNSGRPGGSGSTIIGYLAVTPGETLNVIVGKGGDKVAEAEGGKSYISKDGAIIAYANGGNTRVLTGIGSYGGGNAGLGPNSSNILSHTSINGGDGGHCSIGQNDRDSIGAASYWGSAPAYGGGLGGGVGFIVTDAFAGEGYVLFEW